MMAIPKNITYKQHKKVMKKCMSYTSRFFHKAEFENQNKYYAKISQEKYLKPMKIEDYDAF